MAEELRKLRNGERITGIVIAVNQSETIVDLGLKLTGIIPARELDPIKKPEEVVKIGDELELVVIKVSDMDGIVILSKRKADAEKRIADIIKSKEENTVLQAEVTQIVRGGVNVYYHGFRVFIPASQTGLPRDADLEALKGQTVSFTIIEVPEHRTRKSFVGSIVRPARTRTAPSDDVLQEIRDMRREMQLMMNDMHYTLQSIHALCEEIKNQKK